MTNRLSAPRRETDTNTIRREAELIARFERAVAEMPYPPTVAATVRRGFVLALEELERMKGSPR